MSQENPYSRDEVLGKLDALIGLVSNLDNENAGQGIQGDESMPNRIREKVIVDGKPKWVTGYSRQEIFDNYVKLLEREGLIEINCNEDRMPEFGDYLRTFYDTFKQQQETNTIVNRERIIRNHVIPKFGKKRIDRIQTADIQQWLNSLGKKYSRETIMKIKNVMSPVFDSAVEDEMITRNPFVSKRLVITGKETVHHKAIPRDKFDEIKMGLKEMNPRERLMGGLLCYTACRFEEVLGAKWDDFDGEWFTVRRAVVHPNRNMPEVKSPKTKSSERMIPLHEDLKALLDTIPEKERRGYLLWSGKRNSPLSYTEARRAFDKIRKKFGIGEFTAHDFRDSCATVWRENGMSLDLIARLMGHSKTETTEKRYVKYRTEMMQEAKEKM